MSVPAAVGGIGVRAAASACRVAASAVAAMYAGGVSGVGGTSGERKGGTMNRKGEGAGQ